MMKRSMLVLLAAAACCYGQADGLPNGDFEAAEGDAPESWATHLWAGSADFDYVREGRNGSWCLRISSTEGGDASWFVMAPVEPFALYRLSGWVRTEKIENAGGGRGALLNVHNLQPARTPAVTGTTDWTRVETLLETGDVDSLHVNCLLGGWGRSTGTAWYDDLKLELVSMADLDLSATIHADAEKAPLNEMIYGQFIEHLGRCIYGGIWAEMIEDRKFFHAVGAEESPWKAIGDEGAVSMSIRRPFVGEHDLVIKVDGEPVGIAQSGLGLVSGKRYDGRIILSATADVDQVVVSLIWGDEEGDRDTVTLDRLGEDMKTMRLRYTAEADTDDARLEIIATGSGVVHLGTLSLMPEDNIRGMRKDTLALLKELDSPIYRWPGGNFVSGYDWEDGIGDRDKRPPRKNPAWLGVEHNDFGLDEFMTFCRELGTEPYIVVNSGLGGLESAVEELLYANAPASTPMGKKRAANGHAEPYEVIWWGIGNEMYGGWQLGHMPLEDYTRKHNEFAEAMREADPSIKLIGVGAVGEWTEGMLTDCAGHMESLSEHFYRQEGPGLLGHVRQIPESIRQIADAHRQYRKDIPAAGEAALPVALDEWNYWYGPELYGQIGTRYFLKDALGVAAGMNEFARQSEMFIMANYAQTVNVIGAIKTSKTAAEFDTTGLVLKLYRERFGSLPVEVEIGDTPLDIAAAWTEDREMLTIAVVNPTEEAVELEIDIKGAELTGRGRRWVLTGEEPMSYNEPGKPRAVDVAEEPVRDVEDALELPRLSVCLYELRVR